MKCMVSVFRGGAILRAISLIPAISLMPFGGGRLRAADSTPTFNKDVAPIIFNSCASCHRPDQIGPMSLLSYKDVRPWARAIKAKVVRGEMPPWFADPRFGEFRNDRRLSAEQIQTITAWADGGAPEGDAPLTVEPPAAQGGWLHPSGRPPDFIVQIKSPFLVPATGEIPNFTIYEELPEELKKEDHLVEAWQFQPSEFTGVHHGNLTIQDLPPGTKIGEGEMWPGGPVAFGALLNAKTGKLAGGKGDTAENDEALVVRNTASVHFGPYVVGANFEQFPPGAGKRIPHDVHYMQWGMHYTPIGRAFRDTTRVGLWWQKDVTREIVQIGGSSEPFVNNIVMGKEIIEDSLHPPTRGAVPAIPVIPPNTNDWTLTAIRIFRDDTTLYSMMPHMHQRGKTMTFVLVYPDGKEQVLMSNLKYDFNWQLHYELKEPLKIPAGSTLRAVGSYDNSSMNKWNPAPQNEVYWSEQSWDEMFSPWMDASIDKMDKKVPAAPAPGTPSGKPR